MLRLIQLGLRRWKSPDHYRDLQRHIALASLRELQVRGIRFSESRVLELGAGRGGYASVFCQEAKSLIACDFQSDNFFSNTHIPFCVADVARSLPFSASYFDVVYGSSLIEHIAEPKKLLGEIRRVLKPGGKLYLSFPPFYSLSMVGGHNFKPFHFLGERWAISIVNRLRKTHFRNYATCYDSWGLRPLKIDEVERLILESRFEICDIYTRMSVLNTARLPGILKDLATWHACYLAEKPLQ